MQQNHFIKMTELGQSTTSPYCNTSHHLKAATNWYLFGLSVIPIIPTTKLPALKWDSWLDKLSIESIEDFWLFNPSHELGFIVGDDLIVFDADSPKSIAALVEIEKAFGITPNLITKTT